MVTDAPNSQALMSSQTSASAQEFKPKAVFSHYGFLLVDSWCAYGVHVDVLPSLRDSLSRDGAIFLDSIVQTEQASNASLTYEKNMKPGEKGLPRAGQRVLKTWPVNSLWTEFLIDLEINDSDASNAEEQFNAFLSAKGWKGQEKSLLGFMSCLQLWYYGMSKDKVWSLSCVVLLCRNRWNFVT
jgi:hypothetical protein